MQKVNILTSTCLTHHLKLVSDPYPIEKLIFQTVQYAAQTLEFLQDLLDRLPVILCQHPVAFSPQAALARTTGERLA